MPNVARAHPHLPHVTLNSDGRPHPLLNTLTLITLVFGIVSFALGFVVRAHLAASVLGLVALAIGLYAQMVSETREERMLIVTGLVAAFVGVSLGFAHGGFAV
jgi:glucose-6-phosphate-specific signal transduction histidine kinase